MRVITQKNVGKQIIIVLYFSLSFRLSVSSNKNVTRFENLFSDRLEIINFNKPIISPI